MEKLTVQKYLSEVAILEMWKWTVQKLKFFK